MTILNHRSHRAHRNSSHSKRLLDQGHTIHFLTTRKQKIITTRQPTKGITGIQHIQEIDLTAFTDVSCIVNLVGATIAKEMDPSL